MGYFSWRLSGTDTPIMNQCSGAGATKATMLSPNGGESYTELNYEGYGIFGGKDAYVHLCDMNLPEHKDKTEEFRRSMGLALDMGNAYADKDTGKLYSFHFSTLHPDINDFTGNYATKQEGYDLTPNELKETGQWITVPLREMLITHPYLPLKFTQDENAKYENLPAAENANGQGFWGEFE